MVLSGGAITFLLFSTVSIHVIHRGAADQSGPGTSPVASASPIATGTGSQGQATGQGGPGSTGNPGGPGGIGLKLGLAGQRRLPERGPARGLPEHLVPNDRGYPGSGGIPT
jgi:hypothetical protein